MDERFQPRKSLFEEEVQHYANQYLDGAEFPPIVVFKNQDDTYTLASGFHRFEVYKRLKHNCVEAEIREGSALDILVEAYNAARNLRILNSVCDHMVKKESTFGTKIEIDGIKYKSIRELAQAYALDRRQVSHRLQWGWTPKQAVGLEPRHRPTPGKSVTYKGKKFRSRNELARYHGVPVRLFESRMGKGWSIKDALEKPNRLSTKKRKSD